MTTAVNSTGNGKLDRLFRPALGFAMRILPPQTVFGILDRLPMTGAWTSPFPANYIVRHAAAVGAADNNLAERVSFKAALAEPNRRTLCDTWLARATARKQSSDPWTGILLARKTASAPADSVLAHCGEVLYGRIRSPSSTGMMARPIQVRQAPRVPLRVRRPSLQINLSPA